MDDRDNSGGMAVVIGLVLILLLIGGGAGTFYFVRSHRMALATQQALLVESQARLEAERARAEAIAVAAVRTTSQDPKPAAVQGEAIQTAIESILRAQEDAWNRGDLDAFMKHYWDSDDLTFSAEGKTTRGWSATMARYRERYPSVEKMGRLQLSGLEITPLSDSAGMVLGQWNVQRADGEPLSGNFSLVVRKFEDRWLIVHDHTSRTRD